MKQQHRGWRESPWGTQLLALTASALSTHPVFLKARYITLYMYMYIPLPVPEMLPTFPIATELPMKKTFKHFFLPPFSPLMPYSSASSITMCITIYSTMILKKV